MPADADDAVAGSRAPARVEAELNAATARAYAIADRQAGEMAAMAEVPAVHAGGACLIRRVSFCTWRRRRRSRRRSFRIGSSAARSIRRGSRAPAGESTVARPPGPLVWVHGASVGEWSPVIPLVERIVAKDFNVLVTSGTVTSAKLAEQRLPPGVIHQFVPLDAPRFVAPLPRPLAARSGAVRRSPTCGRI